MALARTESADQTAQILGRLNWHNRFIGLLRIAVPAAGLVAFLVLASQIYLANIARQYGVSGIRIDRGNLVVETPQYSGTGSDGSRYLVTAREARSPIDNTQLIDMSDAILSFTRTGKTAFHASAANATIDTGKNLVTVPGVTDVNSDDGLHGTLTSVRSDMKADVTTADGPVDLTFPDGTTLTASNMHYDGNTAIWTFGNATLTMRDLPKAGAGAAAEPAP